MLHIPAPVFQAEYMFNGASRAAVAVAPRLFCDICDAFDLHDTEDCPTQAMPDPEEEVLPRNLSDTNSRMYD